MPTLIVGMWRFSRVFHMPPTSVGMVPRLFRNRNDILFAADGTSASGSAWTAVPATAKRFISRREQ